MVKKVAIIGAGSSGLTAIKACLEEDLDPVCFEVTNEVGGLWKYREEDIEGLASVMKGTYMNTSKEMSAFSDFTPPDDYPNYMPHKLVHKYLSSYADHFKLRSRCRFGHRVLSVQPHPNYEEDGRWLVKALNLTTGEEKEEEFDAVMISAGHHVYPYSPKIPGLEKFKGQVIHSHSYKKPDSFHGVKALVIGLGNSGGDISVELSRVGEQVYLSSRQGSWIHSRLGSYGKPFDIQFYRRKDMYLKGISSFNSIFTKAEKELNFKVDHEFYNLKPNRRIYNQYTIFNDELAMRLLNGTVKLKRDVERFTETGVVFKDGSEVKDLDLVVFATGYEMTYPFLAKDVVDFDKDPLDIYRFVFPVNLKYPATLSFVGLIDPEGSVFTTAEMQSRWIARVLTGKAKLPRKEWMENTITKTGEMLKEWSYDGYRHKTRIFWYLYMDKLASYIGAVPNLSKLLFTDPKLFWACFTGPVMAYQYRVNGPHNWSGAREAILSYENRVNCPLSVGSEKDDYKRAKPHTIKTKYAPIEKAKKVAVTFALTFGVFMAYVFVYI